MWKGGGGGILLIIPNSEIQCRRSKIDYSDLIMTTASTTTVWNITVSAHMAEQEHIRFDYYGHHLQYQGEIWRK